MAKFPNVKVRLIGQDGNAFFILAATEKAMRKAGVDEKAIDDYTKDATSGDYDHLLQVTMQTVNVS